MNRSASEIFSLKTLAWCWVGVLTSAGTGAMALQLTVPAPVVVQVASQPAPVPSPVVAPPPPIVASVPFENRSLLAMLPPPAERPLRQAARVSVPLPVPPVPPAPRVAHLEQHRVVHVYAAERAYAPPAEWAPYANQYVRFMPYALAAPPSYNGW